MSKTGVINKPVFILPSVSDRVHQLNNMITSIRNSPYKDWAIAVIYQDYLNNANLAKLWMVDHFFVFNYRMGVVPARLKLLSLIPRYKYYGHIDDDMLLMEQTNYFPMLEFLDANPHVANVMSNWIRTESLIEGKIKNIDGSFKKQILFYTGGGQFYRDDVSELFRRKYKVGKRDNEMLWSIIPYVEGYDNYFYNGSLAFHKILQRGGNQDYRKYFDKKDYIGFPEYIEMRQCGDGSFSIPMDADVNNHARELHSYNQKKIFGSPKLIIPRL